MFREEADRGLALPWIGVAEEADQFRRGKASETGHLASWRIPSAQPVDAAGIGIDLALVILAVGDVFLAEVGDGDGAVGCWGEEYRAEGAVVRAEWGAAVGGSEG